MIIYLKTEEEKEGFKEAGKIAANVMKKMLDAIEVGITTKDIDEIARDECKKQNVSPAFLGHEGFPAAICSSVNKELVHGIPNDKKLELGDLLSIDIGVNLDGFIGDTAATKLVGLNGDEEVCLPDNWAGFLAAQSCETALRLGIHAAQPGSKLSDIAIAISNQAKHTGHNMPLKYGGHGINRHDLHSAPFVANNPEELGDEDIVLRPGMIIAIEPMFVVGDPTTKVLEDKWTVIVSGSRATHFEHTILIEEDGPIVLTDRR